MSKYKRQLFFLLPLFFVARLHAQQKMQINGVVYDSTAMPLASAIVTASKAGSRVIQTYVLTDEKGKFILQADSAIKIIIEASLMGYQTKSVMVDLADSLPSTISFYLNAEVKLLKEVILKSISKIREHGDTITFNADAFRDSTERNLEDLLEKIPGFQVNRSTGIISVYGVPIKKILIEGDDLTDRNYQAISKNLSANSVQNLQILNNFSENTWLKGILESTDKALNITLKNDKKSKITGEVFVAGGTNKKYDNTISILNVSRNKLKSFHHFNTNNTSTFLFNKISLANSIKFDPQFGILADVLTPVINTTSFLQEELQNLNLFNESIYSNQYFNYKAGKKILIKGGTTFYKDRQSTFSDLNVKYFTGDSTQTYTEENKVVKKPVIFHGQLNTQYTISKKIQLIHSFLIQQDNEQTNNLFVINKVNSSNAELEQKKNEITNKLELGIRLNNQSALLFRGLNRQYRNRQMLALQYAIPVYFSAANRNVTDLLQSIVQPLSFSSADILYYHSRKRWNNSAMLGYISRYDRFNSNLTSSVFPTGNAVFTDSFTNILVYKNNVFVTGITTRYQMKQSQFFISVYSGVYNTDVSEKVFFKRVQEKKMFFTPSMGLKTKYNKHALDAVFFYTPNAPNLIDLITQPVLTDNRTLTTGSTQFLPQTNKGFLANYTFNHPQKDFVSYVNFSFSRTNKGYTTNSFIVLPFTLLQKIPQPAGASQLQIASSSEKYVSFFQSRFYFNLVYARLQNNFSIQNKRHLFIQNEKAIEVKFRTSFEGPVNLFAGTRYRMIRSRLSEYDNRNPLQNTTSRLFSFVDFHFKIAKNINVQVSNEVNRIYQVASIQKPVFISGFRIGYSFAKSKLRLNINGRNLFNNTLFIEQTFNNFSESVIAQRFNKRFVLFEMQYSF